jgi:hypothetical protein
MADTLTLEEYDYRDGLRELPNGSDVLEEAKAVIDAALGPPDAKWRFGVENLPPCSPPPAPSRPRTADGRARSSGTAGEPW